MSVKSCALCLPWFKKLVKTRNKSSRRKFFKKAPKKVLKSLREIIKNILNGKIRLKNQQKRRLRRYKNVMRTLSNNNFSEKRRKTILIQKGGFLPNLLVPIISLLASSIVQKILQ